MMEIKLQRADRTDAQILHEMQVASFQELYDRYQDHDTSPANEGVDKMEERLRQETTYYYFILCGQQKAGAVRVIDEKQAGKSKWISPIFILPEFQDRGIAQEAIRLCEEIHGAENWELETIMQEGKNCHLYEKMGYRKTGRTEVINDKLTLIYLRKY